MKYIFMVFLLVGTAFAGEWTTQDAMMQGALSLSLGVDYLQTIEITRNDNYYETNLILGKHPTKTDVGLYFSGCLVGSYLIARALPRRYRTIFQGIVIGGQISTIIRNYQLGIRIRI